MSRRTFRLLLLLLLALPLSGCPGGGSGGDSKVLLSENLEDNESGPPKRVPEANAGEDQYVVAGSTATLDGSGSTDPDDDPLSYKWQQTDGPVVSLPDKFNPNASFVAPLVSEPTVHSFELEVSDGLYDDEDTVHVVVMPFSDTTPPQIVSRDPQNGLGNVSASVAITVVFSEPLLASTINEQSFTLRENGQTVAGTVEYDVPSLTATLTTTAQLAPLTSYTATLSSTITDSAGNPLTASTWSFTTGSFQNLGPTPQAVINACMSDFDKDMLSRVNDARAQARSCGTSSFPAAAPLAWSCKLEDAALRHSIDMAANDFFSHTGSDDTNAGQRIAATGYQASFWGENIAGGYLNAAAAMADWLASPGHCANIMRTTFTELGAALAINPAAAYENYWTQVFAVPRP